MAMTMLWEYCMFFGKHDGHCRLLGSCAERCQGDTDGTVCAKFISYDRAISKRYGEHRVTFYDVVNWGRVRSIDDKVPSHQKSMFQFKEVTETDEETADLTTNEIHHDEPPKPLYKITSGNQSNLQGW
jgi:hypothetical protein